MCIRDRCIFQLFRTCITGIGNLFVQSDQPSGHGFFCKDVYKRQIGAMLIDNEAIMVASELITGEDFYQKQMGVVYDLSLIHI